MIDYKTFLITMNKTIYNKKNDQLLRDADSWDWENSIIERIK